MGLYPRLVIGGVHSGVGKTTIATAIMAALTRQGLKVQPFKVGPDYIDPGYHSAATGRKCRNLDAWFMDEDRIREAFIRSATGADVSIIEGVMGLYDGRDAGQEGSTAQVAKILQAPVLLIVNAGSMAGSAAALVHGYRTFDPEVNVAGVFLNKVGSPRHLDLLRRAIEGSCGIPVLGYAGRWAGLDLPERHLGLLPTSEKENVKGLIGQMADRIQEGMNINDLLTLSQKAPSLTTPSLFCFPSCPKSPKVRLGVILDDAFHFYYQDGLDLLNTMGAELVYCSALQGDFPEDLDGLYIGGGFPEMFANKIAANQVFIKGLRKAWAKGMPIYAECGGLMYLSQGVTDFEGNHHKMAGIIPGQCCMEKKRMALGYVTAVVLEDNVLASKGDQLKGHEFHYSSFQLDKDEPRAYRLVKEGVSGHTVDGYVKDNVLATYLHIHFAAHPQAAQRLIDSCLRFKKSRETIDGGALRNE